MAFQDILLLCIFKDDLQIKHWLFQHNLLLPAEQSGALSACTYHAHMTHIVPWSHPFPTAIIWTYNKYLKALPWSQNTAWFITLRVQPNANSIWVLSKNLLNTTTKSRPRLSPCTSQESGVVYVNSKNVLHYTFPIWIYHQLTPPGWIPRAWGSHSPNEGFIAFFWTESCQYQSSTAETKKITNAMLKVTIVTKRSFDMQIKKHVVQGRDW